jgi:hypothetical protein
MGMSGSTYNVDLINDVTFQANEVAALGAPGEQAVTNNGNGTYTEDGSTYGGAFSDFDGPNPAANVATVTFDAYNASAAPGIVTYSLTYQNGTVVPGFGGEVIGWNSTSVLIEDITGFVANNQSQGTWEGTLNPDDVLWVSAQDISYDNGDNGGNGPNFPVNWGTSGTQPDFTTLICFGVGTAILTPRGEVAVESLRAGDRVTLAAGGTAPIVWIGKGKVLATRGRRNAATPVIVRKGSLGDNVPNRDLRVTKAHSFYIDGVLIPVEFLVNHRSIIWDDRAREFELYHIELENHDVLVANGAPAESYRDDGNRWLFQNANSGWGQPPKAPCAPVMTGGPIVDAIWRRLLERAGPRPNVPLTGDPDLHVMVDGMRVEASECHGLVHVFRLNAGSDEMRIVSRAAAPAELGLARDPRVLGVALRSLVVRQGTRFHVLEAADSLLAQGFHGFEQDNAFRWTDGDAVVPAALFEGFTGPVELVLQLGGTTQYLDQGVALLAA